MTLTETQMTGMVAAWMWPFARISAMVASAPVFGSRTVPARVKLGVALALTLVVAPLVPAIPDVDPLSAAGMLITGEQVIVGLAIGFAARLAFAVLEVAGQQIAQLMGLGFASMVDPNNGSDVPVVSQFYVVLGTLVFLAIDGHLVLVEALARSFSALPIGSGGIAREGLWALAGGAGWVFSAAVAIALPAVAALLTVNIAFGVITRTSPQLNIFAVGFPVTIAFGFVIAFATLPMIVDRFGDLLAQSLGVISELLGGTP